MSGTESLDCWIARVLALCEYCLTIKGVASFSEGIFTNVVNQIVAPLVEELGTPLGGFEVYAFAGRYKCTPFGVHDDIEDSFLLHLGPNPKTAWIWSKEQYREQFELGNNSRFNYKRATATGEHFTLHSGDLLFVPKGVCHVLESPLFSTTLSIVPNSVTVSSLIIDAVSESVNNHWLSVGDFDMTFSSVQEFCEKVRSVSSRLYRDSLHFSLSIESALNRRVSRLRSNGYLESPPMVRDINMKLEDCHFVRVHNCPVILLFESGTSVLFLRGREFRVPNCEGLDEFVEYINTETFLSGKVLLAILRKYLPVERCDAILANLYSMRAIESVNR